MRSTSGGVRRGSAVVALTAVLAVLPADAFAQTPAGVSISPARVEQDQGTRIVSMRFQIANGEQSPRRITMSVSGLAHDLGGAPQFLEPAEATEALRLDATSFTLDAGERRTVTAIGAIPDGKPALYAAVIAEFAPTDGSATADTRSRVASLLLIRGPKPWRQTVSIEDAGFLPGPSEGTLTVFAAVKDTGDVHVRPTGTARIVKDGVVLATLTLKPEVVLPGYARRLVATWRPPAGLTGRVTLDVTTSPAARRTAAFDLGPNAARRPQVKIVNLRARDEGGAVVSMLLTNTGTVPVAPSVTVLAAQDNAERARTILVSKTIAPGRSAELEWRPELDDGVYVITAQARSGELLLDESSTGLRLGAAPKAAAAPGRPSRTAALIVAALLLLVATAAVILVARRRRKTEPSEQEETRLAA